MMTRYTVAALLCRVSWRGHGANLTCSGSGPSCSHGPRATIHTAIDPDSEYGYGRRSDHGIPTT